jgi:hypothetical protein
MESRGQSDWFGNRDFYALCKMLVVACSDSHDNKNTLTWRQMECAVLRNFGGGSGMSEAEVLAVFRKFITLPGQDELMHRDDVGHLGPVALIKQALQSGSDSRYILVLTECLSVMGLLMQLIPKNSHILFGSAFPKDHSYAGVCSNLHRIKLCMEAGQPVVLCQLDNLYESLYDALNQFHVVFGGHRYVDLGLGSQRVKCRVHPDFRLIIVAERQSALQRLPIPLLNRLEKHHLSVKSALLPGQQQHITERLQKFASDFAQVMVASPEARWTLGHMPFVGFQEDSVAGLILQAVDMLGDDALPHAIEEQAQKLLLHLATADGIARLPFTPLQALAPRLVAQHLAVAESGLFGLLCSQFKTRPPSLEVQLLQISTTGRLLSSDEARTLGEKLRRHIHLLSLRQFQTEDQFSHELHRFLETRSEGPSCLVVQCESASVFGQLIACAKH